MMKIKILLIFICGLSVSFSFIDYSFQQTSPQLPSSDGMFIIGAMDDAWETNYSRLDDTLRFNTWHKYADGIGWTQVGVESDALSSTDALQSSFVDAKINENYSNNLLTLMDRWKISKLAYSQRSDYQCEKNIKDKNYWFYTYDTLGTGNMRDVVDGSEVVRYCFPDVSQPNNGQKWIVKNLKSNREQINREWNESQIDEVGNWHVIPRIKINKQYADNPQNINNDVCRIEILDFNGKVIKEINLKVVNFIDPATGFYDGKYIEKYFSLPSDAGIVAGSLFNPDKKSLIDTSCQVDFRVWYYGNSEMWIDRIRVENDAAHRLLSGKDAEYESWLQWECSIANSNPGKIQEFYIEEFEFNCLPSIKYVNQKIDSLTKGSHSLMVNLNYDLFNAHKPNVAWNSQRYFDNNFNAVQLKSFLHDYAKLKTILTVSYALEGHPAAGLNSWPQRASYHPPTLSSKDYNVQEGILSNKAVTIEGYEQRLQGRLDTNWRDGTSFTYVMKIMDTLSKKSGMKLINLTQTHLHYSSGHKLKEVSNEELDMLVNLSLTYGSKGILYFAYHGFGCMDSNYYVRGFLQPTVGCYGNPQPRYFNAYGQNKWKKIREINTRLHAWGKHFMDFQNDETRQSYVYRLAEERNAMASNTFIKEFKTYIPVEIFHIAHFDIFDKLESDPVNETYLQAAFFTKMDAPEFYKFFMVVNRRCSPFISGSAKDSVGGKRTVRMKINPDEFTDEVSDWMIYDLETGKFVEAFNKNTSGYITLGDFMPGQGRLFVVSPLQ